MLTAKQVEKHERQVSEELERRLRWAQTQDPSTRAGRDADEKVTRLKRVKDLCSELKKELP